MTDLRALVSRLDLDQKIGQIQGIVPMDMVDLEKLTNPADGQVPDLTKGFPYEVTRVAQLRPRGVGHLSLGWQLSHDFDTLRAELQRFQDAAREVNPFGIAALVHAEGVNGLVHPEGHQFATPWGQASTWNPALSAKVGAIAASQAKDAGIHLLFSPVLDLARDIRWGRVHETYGEDAELVTRMGIGFINGVHDSGLLATGKHFLGYGTSLGAINQATTQLGRRELVDVYAEPFRRAIAEAGLSVVMNSYNDIDGIPAAANHWLLTEILRGQLGFTGLVVSDYGSLTMLWMTYRTAATKGLAAAQALAAGLDVELPGDAMSSELRPLIEDGTLAEEVLDAAVERVLEVKARFGLIPEIRSTTSTPDPAPVTVEEAGAHARTIAESAITLLANDGILPLTPGAARVAVVGPAADEIRIHFGSYSAVAEGEMPVAIGMIATGQVPGVQASPDVFPDLFQTRLPGIEPVFEESARRLHPEATTIAEAIRTLDPSAQFHDFGSFTESAEELDVAALNDAIGDVDIVIAVVGERTGWVGNHTAGEGRTVATAALPGNQDALIRTLHAAGKRVVTVVVSGRPLLLEQAHNSSAAVVMAPLLGQAAGSAVADLLYGVIEPVGHVPSSFPRHLGQIPLYHGHPVGSGYSHPTLPRLGYTDLPDSTPLYPFGHGLGYTSFDIDLTDGRFDDGSFHVTGTVRNSGGRAGTALVQLYARDEAGSVVRPARQLLDFQHARLEEGGTATVSFTVAADRLAYTWADGTRGVEAGAVTLLLALSSSDVRAETTVEIPEIIVR